MVKLLFINAKMCVKINETPSKLFIIERYIRQDYPLASYLFLVVAKVFNTIFMKETRIEIIKGIQLPMEYRQYIMVQYVDDTSLTLKKEEENIKQIIYILKIFCLDLGLVLNWNKLSFYWKNDHSLIQRSWINELDIIWMDKNDVSKLLGVPFGMSDFKIF